MRALERCEWVALAVLAGLAAGCAEELGPETFRTTRVTGVVRVGGQPVSGGWIEFIPVEGTVGNLRSAAIGPDGRFDADGVAVGRNVIGLVNPPIDPAVARYFHSFASPIRRTIESSNRPLVIDLVQEAAQPRGAKAPAS